MIKNQIDPDPFWVKDNGDEIRLSEMTKAHIANCISCIERGGILRKKCSDLTTEEWHTLFSLELSGRNLLTVRDM